MAIKNRRFVIRAKLQLSVKIVDIVIRDSIMFSRNQCVWSRTGIIESLCFGKMKFGGVIHTPVFIPDCVAMKIVSHDCH